MVYLIANESGQVKIGYSANSPEARVVGCQTGNHEKLRLVWVIDGDRHAENRLHAYAAKHRLNGEWFGLPKDHLLHQQYWAQIYANSSTPYYVAIAEDLNIHYDIFAKYGFIDTLDYKDEIDRIYKKCIVNIVRGWDRFLNREVRWIIPAIKL